MRKLFYGLLLLSLFSCGRNNRVSHEFKGENFHCEYQTADGRIEGHYISYYNNEEVKAEGYFENGYHTGIWKLWDSTGLVEERYYKNPFSCEIIIPGPKGKPSDSIYMLKKNSLGYYPYFEVKEKMVLYAKRIWRFIPIEDNPLIKASELFPIWQKSIVDGNLLYKKESNLNLSNDGNYSYYSTDTKLVGYNIVEDYFYDNIRNVSEKRILGLAPVVIGLEKKATVLPWIYFPEVRAQLATKLMDNDQLPKNIQTLDDLFFFRYFASRIYKEENPYLKDLDVDIFAEGMEKESERIDMELIDSEHDIWLELVKK